MKHLRGLLKRSMVAVLALSLFGGAGHGGRWGKFTLGYSTVGPAGTGLWMAKEIGAFEKYGTGWNHRRQFRHRPAGAWRLHRSALQETLNPGNTIQARTRSGITKTCAAKRMVAASRPVVLSVRG